MSIYHPLLLDPASEACHVCGESLVFGACGHEDFDEVCPECGHDCDSQKAIRYQYLDYDHPIRNEDIGTVFHEVIDVWECWSCFARHPEEIRQCHRCQVRYHVDVDEVTGGVCQLCEWLEEAK